MIVHPVKMVATRDLCTNPDNPKKPMGLRYRKGLSASLKQFGFAGLFVVAPNSDGSYEILNGNTRFEDLDEAGVKEVPCVVLDIPPDERKLFALTYDRHSKPFDEDKVVEQLRELAQRGHDLNRMAALTATENLQRLIGEADQRAKKLTQSGQSAMGANATQGSLVLYGPSEDIEHCKSILKRVRGRLGPVIKLRSTVEQADAYLGLSEEQFLVAFLSALDRYMESV